MKFSSIANGWSRLSALVCDKLSENAVKFLERYLGADLIIVAGSTGVGKSAFIQSVTGEDVYISSSLNSGTMQTALVPAFIKGKRYLLLDMPGFGAADISDWTIFNILITAMATIKPYVKFRGLIYVDKVDARVTTSQKTILTWIHNFCGMDYMPNVTIVTTKWDDLSDAGVRRKLERYSSWAQGDLIGPLLSNGAQTFHHGLLQNDDCTQTLCIDYDAEKRAENAREMIHERYHATSDLLLQLDIEIAKGLNIHQTSAGSWLDLQKPANDGDFLKLPNPPSSNGMQPSTSESEPDSWAERLQTAKPWVKILFYFARFFFGASSSANQRQGTENDSSFEAEIDDLVEFQGGNLEDENHEGNSWCAVM